MNETAAKNIIQRLAVEMAPTDAYINASITLVVNDLCSKNDFFELQRDAEVTITDGEGSLPSDFQRMISVWYVDEKRKLEPDPLYLFEKDFIGVGIAGIPSKYSLWAGKLLVYPKIASATMNIKYIQKPSGLRDLEESRMNAVVMGTVRLCFPYGSREYGALSGEYRASMSEQKPLIREKKPQMTLSEERKRKNVRLSNL